METEKKKVNHAKIKSLLSKDRKKKKLVKTALNFDRFQMSRLLNGKRDLEFSEGLIVAEILGVQPSELLN
jgi:hypothetical protein